MELQTITGYLKNQKTLNAISIVFALLLALTVLLLTRDIISVTASAKKNPAPRSSVKETPIKLSLKDYAPVLANNPFGFPAGELSLITLSSAGPAISQTDLTLIGTVAGRKDLSYAILADKSGRQDVFRIGDGVFGLGKLTKIETAKIYVNSNGKEVGIPLKDLADIRDIKQPVAPSSSSFGKRVGDSSYQIDQQRVQQAIDKPDQIMTDARFVPNIIDGKQQGFVLREVKPGGIYSSLGLQNGDVLLRINEFTISNPETALQAFTALRGIDRAQLDIIRNSAKMTMTYQIK